MDFIHNIKDFFYDFIHKNTKVTVSVIFILIVFVLFSFIMGIFHTEKKQKPIVVPEQIPYSAIEDFFPPQKENFTEDYYFSREQTSSWSKEEFDKWFTVPSEENVENLGKSNQKRIEEILGAAP